MAVRNDVSIAWNVSPRIITVAAPSTEITVQDIVDTVRIAEADLNNLDNDHIVNASGKEDLGGSVSVGITLELQNAQLAFESRDTPTSSGTATAGGTTTLTDGAGTFVTDSVARGAMIVNHTDGSQAEVLAVSGEGLLTHTALEGGTANDWTIGDAYDITNFEQCDISGGNLVAVDSSGIPITPVFTTFGTQIVRTSSSSATLQELQDIQFASFAGGVWYDAVNGTSGTVFPQGTERAPVDNFSDLLAIGTVRGFNTAFIRGDATVDLGLDYTDWVLIGQGQNLSTFTISAAAVVPNLTIIEAEVTGTLDGDSHLEDCIVSGLLFVSGVIERCILNPGTITLGGGETAHFIDCRSGVPGTGTPEIDMGGSGQDLALRNYNGGVKISNCTGAQNTSVDLNSGQVILASTVTAGTFVVRGVGKLVDESGDRIPSGTWNGATIVNELMSVEEVWARVIDGQSAENLMAIFAAGLAGKASGFDGEAGTNTVAYRDLLDSKDVIAATVDEFGNRQSVTLDP